MITNEFITTKRSFNGQVIGADELTDLAVVKIDATDLKVAEFGNSDDIMVGDLFGYYIIA